jgi:hypothetical protein
VTFSPLSTGAKTGSVSVPSDAPSTPDSVSLAGNGIQPALGLSVLSHNFGNQLVGTTSGAYTVTVTNTGTADLHVGTLGITGPFALTADSCTSVTVTPSNTCTFGVTFSPVAIGAASGSVSIPSDAPTSPDSVALSGTGLQPVLGLSTNVIAFGNVTVNTTSAPQSVTITNTGTANLQIGTLGITGPYALNSDACSGATVAPSATCVFSVTFSPLATGLFTGSVTIPSNAPSNPDSVSLSGTGTPLPVDDNLLLNPGFDQTSKYPRVWSYSVPRTLFTSLLDCTTFISPSCSLKLPGFKATGIVTQTVSYSGAAGQQFAFGLSSRALNVPADGMYTVEVALFNRFNRVMYTQTLTFADGTHDWQAITTNFTAPTAFTKMRFRIYFQKTAGWAWFDDAFLTLLP